jgi:hypothetical protein
MLDQTNGQETIQDKQHMEWLRWAERHPGIMLMGALVVTIVALRMPSKTRDTDRDISGEEVPLFI